MPFSDFEPERVSIEYKGRELAKVRGLSLDDISVLVRGHYADLLKLYEIMQTGDQDIFRKLNVDDFLVKLLTDFPTLAAAGIALAADEPASAPSVRKLPMPIQIMTIRTIVKLTFEDVGGPKAFGAVVQGLLGQ